MFVCNLWLWGCLLRRKQFHEKLSAFIQFTRKKRMLVMMTFYFLSRFVVSCVYSRFLFMHISNCVNLFVYQSLSVLIVMFRYPAAEIHRFVISVDMLWSSNMPAAWFSSLWSLRYQMNVSKQHPCSPLFSTVLACIWCHVGGMRSALHSFLKTELSRENKSRQRSRSSSPVHPEAIFKRDARHYSQGHRKVRTSCNVRGMVKEHGFKITKVKWSKG